MREHVMKEFDKNNDRMVSYEEFDRGMKAPEARNEQGWKVSDTNYRHTNFNFVLF